MAPFVNCFVRISMVSMIIMITPLTDTVAQAESLFQEIFKVKKNVFSAVFLIDTLPERNKMEICRQMTGDPRVAIGGHRIKIVQTNLSTQSTVCVPVFTCLSSNANEEFFMTYSTSSTGRNPFFKLANARESNNIIHADVVEYQQFNTYFRSPIGSENEIMKYFRSADYRMLAEQKLSVVEWGNHWVTFCGLFVSIITQNPPQLEDRIHNIDTIFYNGQKAVRIPLLSCPMDAGFLTSFYIGYYTDNIYFRVNIRADGKGLADHNLECGYDIDPYVP